MKIRNLRVSAPRSRLAIFIGACPVLEWFPTSAAWSRVTLIIAAWLLWDRISKSSAYAGVASAVELGFH